MIWKQHQNGLAGGEEGNPQAALTKQTCTQVGKPGGLEFFAPHGKVYEDCMPVLAFLTSEEPGYLNGQAIAIDGGRRLIA